jgi:DNA invertase Pin-like site-specific DNA recombinase
MSALLVGMTPRKVQGQFASSGTAPARTMQTRELQKYAEARGWTVTGEYLDEGVSGAKDWRRG